MNVMLRRCRAERAGSGAKDLHQYGNHVRGIACDVADPDHVERAAQATFAAFGKVHVVCNNAGVAAGGGIDRISVDNWRWVVDVNLMGVVYGIRSFLPQMREHGEGGHIVNTASMAGMINNMGFSPYAATKFAVVAMSEGLRMQLAPFGIGVSVLCPRLCAHAEDRREDARRAQSARPLRPIADRWIRTATRPRPWSRKIQRQIAAGHRPWRTWPRASSRRSGPTSSTSSPIRTCARSSRDGSTLLRPPWTG